MTAWPNFDAMRIWRYSGDIINGHGNWDMMITVVLCHGALKIPSMG
jgi:hypothetical protein